MIRFLAKKFIPDYENVSSQNTRMQYGVLCGALGIVFNIILFAAKLCAGVISGSIAITADAMNNLSDAGSSVIMMVGFKMSSRKPNVKHPYGHGRIEYITGLVVSMLIILMGVELMKSSVEKIIHPEDVRFSYVVVLILVLTILVKCYMYYYNNRTGKMISSVAMHAVAMDCCSDMASTAAVLVATVIAGFTGLKIDGWVGIAVSAFILYSGITSAKDTIDTLLGNSADPEFVETLEKFVLSHEGILGIHDLIVHDYGPGRMMISLHAEVPANGNIMELHDTIDIVEAQIQMVLGAHATIHLDPVVIDDEKVSKMKRIVTLIAQSIDKRLSIHDFRMVEGPTHTNLIFDVVLPYEVAKTEEELKAELEQKIFDMPGTHFAVIHVDRPFC